MSAGADLAARRAIVGAAALVSGGLLLLPAPVAALAPAAGAAVVDGSAAEWTPADEVASLLGNDPPHLERGRVSLRYDCDEEVLYALVMAGPGLRLEATDPDEAYLRLGSDPKLVSGTDVADGDPPDAAWVGLDGGTAAGIEMSADLGPGSHEDLRVHAKLPNASEDGYETLDLSPRFEQLVLACPGDVVVADAALVSGPEAEAEPADVGSGDLARTGAPLIPALAGLGVLLVAGGAAVRMRRWGRPAGP